MDLILEQFDDHLVQILLAVSGLSGVFSFFEMRSAGAEGDGLLRSFVEPLVILTILILNAAVGVWQSKSAEGSRSVLRDGTWIRLDNIRCGVDDGDVVVPNDDRRGTRRRRSSSRDVDRHRR